MAIPDDQSQIIAKCLAEVIGQQLPEGRHCWVARQGLRRAVKAMKSLYDRGLEVMTFRPWLRTNAPFLAVHLLVRRLVRADERRVHDEHAGDPDVVEDREDRADENRGVLRREEADVFAIHIIT